MITTTHYISTLVHNWHTYWPNMLNSKCDYTHSLSCTRHESQSVSHASHRELPACVRACIDKERHTYWRRCRRKRHVTVQLRCEYTVPQSSPPIPPTTNCTLQSSHETQVSCPFDTAAYSAHVHVRRNQLVQAGSASHIHANPRSMSSKSCHVLS